MFNSPSTLIANPELGSAYAQTMLGSTESWRVIDDDTFEVVAKEPLATFLYDLHGLVIPKHIWENVPIADWPTDGGATGQDPSRVVGSGACKFEELRPGESYSGILNEDYYQKKPYLRSCRDAHLAGPDIDHQRVPQWRDRRHWARAS